MMIPLTVEEVVEATEGKLVAGLLRDKLYGVCTDSRVAKSGDLFIPLLGKADGHGFISDAVKKNIAGTLFSNDYEDNVLEQLLGDRFLIKVDDTLKALQDVATYYRNKLKTKVVAISGSSGKTTTKDMINCVLLQKFKVICTEKNFNNEIGVPLTIFRAEEDTEVLVVEMAMRGHGQIKELSKIAKPDIGIVTNIGQAHIELLGSEQAIAEAKSELVESIAEDGMVILNADDIWTPFVSKCAVCSKIIEYGVTAGDVRAEKIEVDELGRAKFSLSMFGGDSYTVRLPVPGRHNVYNALAASAVASELGLSTDQIRVGLSNCKLSSMRMEVFSTIDNMIILNDAYNASPAAMQAALATLKDVDARGRRIAVLGDMLELGQLAVEAHKSIGETVALLGIDFLVAVGKDSQIVAESAIKCGMAPKKVAFCADAESAIQVLKQLIEPGDVVLVKASRAVGLEAVVKALVKI